MLNLISSTLSLKSQVKISKHGVSAIGLEHMQPFEDWKKVGEHMVLECDLISAWLL